MVMRRVFNHHVCLCVLSTAILAGLALMASQTKVYAQAQNCKGLTGSSDGDDGSGLIVCDGGAEGTGVQKGVGTLTGKRDINMSVHSGQAAVTVTGAKTNITISSELKVTDKSSKNNNPAIKVHKQGKLMLVGGVSVEGVQKGIVVEGPSSSVTVVQGKIGVRKGGGPVIEVKNNGEVVLMEGVTVTGSGGSEGEVVINNGGDVMLMGTNLTGVTMGIVVRGGGNANVKGGATIGVRAGGKGFKVEGTATANVMDMTINGSGGGGTGAEVSSGTLTLNSVTLKQLETGAKVTNGVLTMEGSSTINVAAGGTGVKVSNNGKVEMMGGSITGNGNGSTGTGVEMEGTADVTLMGVTLEQLKTGAKVTGGTLTVNGGSKIKVIAGGKGIDVSSGKVTMEGGSITGNGGSGTGLVMSGNADVTLNGVNISEVQKGVEMGGSGVLKLDGTTTINVAGNGTGMSVTGGNVVMTGTLTITGSGTTGMSVSNGTDGDDGGEDDDYCWGRGDGVGCEWWDGDDGGGVDD
ncbi:hypothetical protein [Bartonella schoenbuchensis]|uniref:hypothetical protein n=1 Tax=Bartonella schoenbuchensis TaxID=165694 RepID=UPI0031454878